MKNKYHWTGEESSGIRVVFAKYFPTIARLWQRLTSRIVCRIALFFAFVLVPIATGLRVYSAFFVHRVHSVVIGMEGLRPDQTTRAEMLTMVPALQPEPVQNKYCGDDECYAVDISNFGGFLQRLRVDHAFFGKGLLRLGGHQWDFHAMVDVRRGRVHERYYSLVVDDSTAKYPGMIHVAVGSLRGSIRQVRNFIRDESPDYQVSTYFKWPSLDLQVILGPSAAPELVHHAFDLRLNCMWQLGCRTARQLLPLVWQDKQKIETAALARMRSSDPCPDRILQPRARDVPNILYVEVKRVQPGFNKYGYKVVDYHLLETLKGAPSWPSARAHPLDGVPHSPIIFGTDMVPNPSINLLRPGARVLMFIGRYGALEEPCEIVAATPSALQTIRSALALPATQAAESEVTLW